MTIFKHEIKLGKISLLIWTLAVAFLLAVCILIYPEMSGQMEDISVSFAQMGGFSEAFGMDKVNFGEFLGFFAIEAGNVLGLGGAFFAALLGITALAKEEKEHTAEFLLTHPKSRTTVIAEKLLAVFVQIIIFNVIVMGASALSTLIIGQEPDMKICAFMFLAYFMMQIEIAAICFGISAFLKRGGLGIGLGIAALFYFLNIIANLTSQAEFLKYITPFAYADGADIVAEKAINGAYLGVGIGITVICIIVAFVKYSKKDIS